jgi:hypothetical protein
MRQLRYGDPPPGGTTRYPRDGVSAAVLGEGEPGPDVPDDAAAGRIPGAIRGAGDAA